MVFDPAAAPKGKKDFLAWYERQAEWSESHGYQDHQVSAPLLQAWFKDLLKTFPPMNGPLAPKEIPEDDALLTDYCFGRQVIYVAFAWSRAKEAYEASYRLAAKHGIGFFDASSDDATVWWPSKPGTLARVT